MLRFDAVKIDGHVNLRVFGKTSVTERVYKKTRGSIPLEKKNVGRIKQLGLDRLPFLEQAKNESVSTLPLTIDY